MGRRRRGAGDGREHAADSGGLSRQRIFKTAVKFIDREGLPAPTMRRLGGVLGVEAMALYRYVPSREDLPLPLPATADCPSFCRSCS